MYLFEDIFGRKAVGDEVCDQESGQHDADLLRHCARVEDIGQNKLVLHSDNGAPLAQH